MQMKKNKQPGFATRAIHAGQEPDPLTGAVTVPTGGKAAGSGSYANGVTLNGSSVSVGGSVNPSSVSSAIGTLSLNSLALNVCPAGNWRA